MSTTQNLTSKANPRTDADERTTSFGEQTKRVADEVRELGSMAVTGAGEALQSLKERGNHVVEGARERAQETLEQGKKQFGKARDGFEGYVTENPFKAILIAAGVGALLGYTLSNRK